eukprot:4197916-Heterocapsa_arctica.AAC.1
MYGESRHVVPVLKLDWNGGSTIIGFEIGGNENNTDYEKFEMGTECVRSMSRRRCSSSGSEEGDGGGAGDIRNPLNEDEKEMKNVAT